MVAGGGCPRFEPVSKNGKKKLSKKGAEEGETKAKKPAESSGIDIKLISIRDILSRDRHKTDLETEE